MKNEAVLYGICKEDYDCIERLYKKLNTEYKMNHGSDGDLRFPAVISFLVEHSTFDNDDIKNFVAVFARKEKNRLQKTGLNQNVRGHSKQVPKASIVLRSNVIAASNLLIA